MDKDAFERYEVDGVLMSITGWHDRAGHGPYWCGRWIENGKRRYRHFGKVDPRPYYRRVIVPRKVNTSPYAGVKVYQVTYGKLQSLADQQNCAMVKVLAKLVDEAWQHSEREKGA